MTRNQLLGVFVAVALIVIGLGGLFATNAFASGPLGVFDCPWGANSVDITRGTVTASSPTSLTITTSSGTSRTFAINDQTHTRGSITQSEKVAVVTHDDGATASAVMNLNQGGRGPWGRWHD